MLTQEYFPMFRLEFPSRQANSTGIHIELIDITVLALARNVFKNLWNVMTRARSGSGLYI